MSDAVVLVILYATKQSKSRHLICVSITINDTYHHLITWTHFSITLFLGPTPWTARPLHPYDLVQYWIWAVQPINRPLDFHHRCMPRWPQVICSPKPEYNRKINVTCFLFLKIK